MNEDNSALENLTLHKLKEKFQDAIIGHKFFKDELTIFVKKSNIHPICRFLKDDEKLQYQMLIDLCGVDNLGQQPRFEVVYHLYSLKWNQRIRLKVPMEENDCFIDSVTNIWATANWHEREAYDMYGIIFNNHPDLRRILNPDDFEGFPLRKDFPLKGKRTEG